MGQKSDPQQSLPGKAVSPPTSGSMATRRIGTPITRRRQIIRCFSRRQAIISVPSGKRTPEHDTRGGPKLVYICAPLLEDAEQNITFAKETAREVFLSGDIPVCPHLMFPPFVDLRDSVQNQAARVMGLRLMETCQQVNVYGPVLTPEMQAETQRAHDLGIPVIFDQKRLEKTRPRPKRGRRQIGGDRGRDQADYDR